MARLFINLMLLSLIITSCSLANDEYGTLGITSGNTLETNVRGATPTRGLVAQELLDAETRAAVRARRMLKEARERMEASTLEKAVVAETPHLNRAANTNVRTTLDKTLNTAQDTNPDNTLEKTLYKALNATVADPMLEPQTGYSGDLDSAVMAPTQNFKGEKTKKILPSQFISLRFQPTSVPLRYTYRMQDVIRKQDWDGQVQHWRYDHYKEYEITSKSVRPIDGATEAPDIHELLTRQTSGVLLYNGRPVDKLLNVKEEKTFGNDLGETTGNDGVSLRPTIAGRPILPERDIAVGDAWQDVRPPKEEFPLEVLTKYKHLGYRRMRGRLCAIIEMNAFAQGHFPDENLSVDLRMKGRFYFSIDEGFVIRYERNTVIVKRTINDKVDGAPYSENRHIRVFYRYKGK